MYEQWLFLLSYPLAYILLRQIYMIFKEDDVIRFISVLLIFFVIPWVNIGIFTFILLWELTRKRAGYLENYFIKILDSFFFVKGDDK